MYFVLTKSRWARSSLVLRRRPVSECGRRGWQANEGSGETLQLLPLDYPPLNEQREADQGVGVHQVRGEQKPRDLLEPSRAISGYLPDSGSTAV
jgi:hypothetical protein